MNLGKHPHKFRFGHVSREFECRIKCKYWIWVRIYVLIFTDVCKRLRIVKTPGRFNCLLSPHQPRHPPSPPPKKKQQQQRANKKTQTQAGRDPTPVVANETCSACRVERQPTTPPPPQQPPPPPLLARSLTKKKIHRHICDQNNPVKKQDKCLSYCFSTTSPTTRITFLTFYNKRLDFGLTSPFLSSIHPSFPLLFQV